MTIEEAKQHLRKNWEKGTECPCCGQFVKRYKRKLNSSMAEGLIVMYKSHKETSDHEWIHVTSFDLNAFRGGDWAKVRYWDLATEKPHEGDTSKRTSGWWKLTIKGFLFVEKKLTLPKYILLYNDKFLDFEGKNINIEESLGYKFNYQELMHS